MCVAVGGAESDEGGIGADGSGGGSNTSVEGQRPGPSLSGSDPRCGQVRVIHRHQLDGIGADENTEKGGQRLARRSRMFGDGPEGGIETEQDVVVRSRMDLLLHESPRACGLWDSFSSSPAMLLAVST